MTVPVFFHGRRVTKVGPEVKHGPKVGTAEVSRPGRDICNSAGNSPAPLGREQGVGGFPYVEPSGGTRGVGPRPLRGPIRLAVGRNAVRKLLLSAYPELRIACAKLLDKRRIYLYFDALHADPPGLIPPTHFG